MNAVDSLLLELERLDIQIWSEAGRLRLSAPKGVMTPELKARLQDAKGDLLLFLETASLAASSEAGETPRPIPRDGDLPLSFAQRRVWFLDKLEHTTVYHIPFALGLHGGLDLRALEASLTAIAARQESLRTIFGEKDGEPIQVIQPAKPLVTPFADLSKLPKDARNAEVKRYAGEVFEKPFDLATGPLLRVLILRLAADEHVILAAKHHIISDGWSTGVLVNELAAYYDAFAHDQPASSAEAKLPPLSIQYADFAWWQRNTVTEKELDRQRTYWMEKLADVPECHQLPLDRPRPARQTFRGGVRTFRGTPEIAEAIHTRCQAWNITPFAFLQSVFLVLLSKWSGQGDHVLGTPAAGRNLRELEPLIGFFINTLALRNTFAKETAFRELVQQVQSSAMAALANQDLPFEQVVDCLKLERNVAYSPLFQIMFALQNSPENELHLPGLRLSRVDTEWVVSKFDLTLSMEEGPHGFNGLWEYNADLFDAGTIDRMMDHFQNLVRQAASNPTMLVDDMELMQSQERRRVLFDWNANLAPAPLDTPVQLLFERQVEACPNQAAVSRTIDVGEPDFSDPENMPEPSGFDAMGMPIFETTRAEGLSYAQLNARANQLARKLRELGVGPEVRVANFTERAPETFIGLWAIWKAGGVYVPLGPAFPKDRLTMMMEDGDVHVVLCQPDLRERLPETNAAILELRAIAYPIVDGKVEGPENADVPAEEAANLPAWNGPDHLAYIIYTSGSTGRPKGTLIAHRGLSNLVAEQAYTLDLFPGARVIQYVSLNFDASLWDIVMAHCTGGCLVLSRADVVLSGPELAAALRDEKITHLTLPPSALANLPDGEFPDLHEITVTGEACAPDLAARWSRRVRMHNGYGPTEVTVGATMGRCRDDGVKPDIGRPMLNTQVYILDHKLRPVPAGVPGEICIGAHGLARGYLHHAGLTATKFVPHPFLTDDQAGVHDAHQPNAIFTDPGMRLYRTGDLARFLADGRIDFLGRFDAQVKIRGFRVELGEIEAIINSHTDVVESVVIVREDRAPVKDLVAYVVQSAGGGALRPGIRPLLKEKLPAYMVPRFFVVLDAFPLTSNGKVNRKALPEPNYEQEIEETAYVAPSNTVEGILADIWAKVLGLKRVSVHDNFFELGGDSILTIQIIARARDAGLQITPKLFFENQTIASLAPLVSETETGTTEIIDITGPMPLTPIQLWYFDKEYPHQDYFNQALIFEVPPDIRGDALKKAVEVMTARHDALRTRFFEVDGEMRAEVMAEVETPFQVIDIEGATEAEQIACQTEIADACQISLNLAEGPIFRSVLFRRPGVMGGKPCARLLFIFHHLAMDGVSWRILMEDLQNAYGDFAKGKEPALPAPSTPYAIWARRLADLAQEPEWLAETPQWLPADEETRALRHRVTRLPRDTSAPDDANTLETVVHHTVEISEEETTALLREVPKAYNTRIDEVLLTALARCMTEWLGEMALVVDLESHGREALFDDVDLSHTAGWFTTLCPLLLQLPDDRPDHALKAVKEQVRALRNRGIGYGMLRHYHPDEEVREALRAFPDAELLFNYHGQSDQAMAEVAGLLKPSPDPCGNAHPEYEVRPFVIEVNGRVSGGIMRVTWTYSDALHKASTIEHLADAFIDVLREVIDHCRGGLRGFTPSDFPMSDLDQVGLDHVLGDRLDVEEVYTLSPMQQGMMYQRLMFDGETDPYYLQLHCEMEGDLHVEAFKHAWRSVIRRFSIFRTAFFWKDLPHPVQVVYRDPKPTWDEWDLRAYTPDRQAERVQEYLAEVKRESLPLDKAPLMRFGLLRLSDERTHFVWGHHHMLTDGWSLSLIIEDAFRIYESLKAGHQPTLPPARPYSDYIGWLRNQDKDAAANFWKQRLAGFTDPNPLPAGMAEKQHITEAHGQRKRDLVVDETRTDAMRAFVRAHRLTMNTLVQGAWGLTMGHFAGVDDVIFGSTVSGRPPELSGMETMIGVFINTLPVRVQMDSRQTVLEWLRKLHTNHVEAERFSYSPLVDVQGWSEVPRGMPLFETAVVFENFPVSETMAEREGALKINSVGGFEQTNFPLAFMGKAAKSMLMEVEYDRNRYTPEDADNILRSLDRLLDAFISDPGQRLDNLIRMDETTRERLLVNWNQTEEDIPAGRPLSWFLSKASLKPTSEALVASDGAGGSLRLTYNDLAGHVESLAKTLVHRGLRPGDFAGICIDRSAAMVTALLAVWRAGAAYVPLDPTFPRERLQYMAEDAGLALLITGEEIPAEAFGDQNLVQVDAMGKPLAEFNGASEVTLPAGAANDTAYAIYTSGSTGKPKGVLVTQENLANFLISMSRTPGFDSSDRMVAVTTISFDIAGLELYLPLITGGTLIVADRDTAGDGNMLAKLLEDEKATVLQATPATWRLLQSAEWQGRDGLRILCGGEALPPDLADFLADKGASVWNMYGPTETTIWSTCRLIAEKGERNGSVDIGRPIANTTVYIVDSQGEPVPPGVPGRLLLGGTGVATGYWNRPSLTAERFLPDPFAQESGVRLYDTGDRVRYLADGRIGFIGRADDQVKIRGYRIEPGEVEAVLARLDEVAEAAVVARLHRDELRLAAYVVWVQTGGDNSERLQVLRERLNAFLPEYMIPGVFTVLDAMPRTPNNKIDRKALPEPDEAALSTAEYVAPRYPNEVTLAAIWQDVLGTEQVGIHDDFFRLGGHSLLGAQTLARIRTELLVDLPLRDLFEYPTIARLAEHIESMMDRAPELNVDTITNASREGRLPLAPSVKRAWDRGRIGLKAANASAAVDLYGPLDGAHLEAALQQMIERHEIFRLRIRVRGGEPVHVFEAATELPFAMVGLSGLMEDERKARLAVETKDEANLPFRPERECPVRFVLWKLASEHHRLLVAISPMAGDAWTANLFLRECLSSYDVFHGGAIPQRPELTVQGADIAAWQEANWRRESVRRHTHWTKVWQQPLPFNGLPLDRPRGEQSAIATFDFSLEGASLTALQGFARENETAVNVLVLAAFQLLAARYSGQSEGLIALRVNNRNRPEVEGTAAPLVDHLPIRAKATSHTPVREWLSAIAKQHNAAREREFFPAGLLSGMETGQDWARLCFDAEFLPQPQSKELRVMQLPALSADQRFDLTLSSRERSGMLALTLTYKADLFQEATAARFAERLERLLNAMPRNIDGLLTDLEPMTGNERERMVVEINDTTAGFPSQRLPFELFRRQAGQDEEAIAIYSHDGNWTYEQLAERVDELAAALIDVGAGPEKTVGLFAKPSPLLAAGPLAVLRSGATLKLTCNDTANMDVDIWLTDEGSKDHLDAASTPIVMLDAVGEADLPRSPALPDHAALILNSGQVLSHRNLMAGLYAVRGLVLPEQLIAVAADSSPTDPASLFPWLTTFCWGGGIRLDGSSATTTLSINRIESDVEAALVFGDDAQDSPECETAVLRAWGPEEMAGFALSESGTEPVMHRWGTPVANVRAYLLDADLQPVPAGMAGDLYLGGAALARCIHDDVRGTAHQFIPNPFAHDDEDEGLPAGSRLVRTGRRARLTHDGVFADCLIEEPIT